jgi:hypothetical protein
LGELKSCIHIDHHPRGSDSLLGKGVAIQMVTSLLILVLLISVSLSSPCKHSIEEFFLGGVTSARTGGYDLMINCIGLGQIHYGSGCGHVGRRAIRLNNSL